MGYYTRYELNVRNIDLNDADYLLQHAKIRVSEIDDGYGTFGSLMDGNMEECKWYDYDADMKKISREHPGVLFELTGDGEEQGDQWITYYKDGKSQHCKAQITFEPYDPNKLVDK